MTPFLAITGFLLFVALSVLVQLAVAKWRYEKKLREQKLARANQARENRRDR